MAFEYQTLALDKFKRLKVGALFMKMGSGKTKVACDLIRYNADKIDQVLWLCPFSVKRGTANELSVWLPEDIPTRIVGYETVSGSETCWKELMDYVHHGKTFLVLDESTFIKNGHAKRWERLKLVRMNCPYCVILNGTPVTRDEWDLYWQMQMLDTRIIPYNEQDFERLFFDKKTITPAGYGKRRSFTKYQFSKRNADALAKLVAPYTFRADPDYGVKVSETHMLITADEATRAEYDEIRRDVLHDAKSQLAIMGGLSRLVQCMAIDANRCGATATRVKELTAQGERVLVYAQFHRETTRLKALIPNAKAINGNTKKADRESILEWFEKTPGAVLIMSYGTGSFGLNLQYCQHVVFNSYGWDWGKLAQAKARVVRIGQDKPVTLDFMESDLKFNDSVRRCVENKSDMSEYVKAKIISGLDAIL